MHNKQQIVDAFSKFLDQMGLPGVGGDDFGEDDTMLNSEVPIWSKIDASIEDEGRGPIHSKESLFKKITQAAQPQQYDNYGMPRDDDAAAMMLSMGIM